MEICITNLPLENLFKFLILTLLFSQPQRSTNAAQYFDCEKIKGYSNCKCEKSIGIIRCLQPDTQTTENHELPSAEININAKVYRLDCHDFIVKNTLPMPEVTFESVPTLETKNCPLSENFTLNDIFAKFELNKAQYENTNLELKQLMLADLLSLDVDFNQLGLLTANAFESVSSLKSLILHNNYQEELPTNLLAPLKNLTQLNLFRLQATQLPVDFFRNNRNITLLSINLSSITQLQKGTIAHLTQLEELNLNFNALTTIAPSAFDTLLNLKTLVLGENDLKYLPDGLFAYTKNLKEFKFANNITIEKLPEDLLANLPNLAFVQISCELTEISANIFNNSTAIETIILYENNFTSLPETLFNHQARLSKLYLKKNFLSKLPDNLFSQNNLLKYLDLSNNQLTEITSEIFKPLTSLETLILKNNHLITFAAKAFSNPYTLLRIDLESNRLQQFSIFGWYGKLTTLSLRNNSITQMLKFSDFFFKSLNKLDLSYNQISNLNLNEIPHSKSGTDTNLANNLIKTIFYNENTTLSRNVHINFDGNPLNCDCELFGFVRFLQQERDGIISKPTDLSCKTPATLKKQRLMDDGILSEFNCRSEICLTACQCFWFPSNHSLTIDCSNTNSELLYEIPAKINTSEWSQFEKLEINLANSNLKSLPNMSSAAYDRVKILKLSNNKLSDLNLENLPHNLKQLDLRNNNFTKITNEALEILEKRFESITLKLSGNPWQCNCELQPLLEFDYRNTKAIADRSTVRCIFPNNTIQTLPQLTIAKLCRPNNTALIVGSSILVALIVIFLILCILYLKYEIEIKIWLYSHQMLLWLITEEELDNDKVYDAFISYSSKDESFVVEHLVPNLENSTPAFKICVHYRDFMVGENIGKNIADAVEKSRRTIVLLSKNFLESDWALHEFRSAHLIALEEKKPRVIVILYGDIGDKEDMDAELKLYLKTRTYLEWNDPHFWQRLRFAMPHTKAHLGGNNLSMQQMTNGTAIVNKK